MVATAGRTARMALVLCLAGAVVVQGGSAVAAAGGKGSSIFTTGDFNDDGFDDLALGVPEEDLDATANAGAVNVIYGGPNGLNAQGDDFWHQDRASISGAADETDHFGVSVAAGDVNGDGFDDLAVGASGEDDSAGEVHLLMGGNSGLAGVNKVFRQGDGLPDQPEMNDFFGSALVIADFGKSSHKDLAIGVQGEGIDGVEGTGAVHILYGTGNGLSKTSDQFWHRDSVDSNLREMPGDNEAFDSFGRALAAGNFGKSGDADLAVGARATIDEEDNAGSVTILFGTNNGIGLDSSQLVHQNQPGVPGEAGEDDNLGDALVGANFGRGSRADLAIGVTGEDPGGVDTAGAVHLLYGSSSGLRTDNDQLWHQDSTGVLDTAEEFDLFGESLGASDFGKSNHADLVVGSREDVGQEGSEVSEAGQAGILYGSSSGLSAQGDQRWNQDSPEIVDTAEGADAFSTSVAGGNFGDGGRADLAVAVPNEDFEAGTPIDDGGVAHVIYGTSTGLNANGSQYWHQNIAGIRDSFEQGDFLGGTD